MTTAAFQKKVWRFYREHGRALPWRATHDAYRILVSEVMLQQTQVSRVIPKCALFLKKFPTPQKLAKASLRDVLAVWSGLGYNRRGRNLQRAAQSIVTVFNGVIPQTYAELRQLPGVGDYTAKAVLAFAHNQPVVMIETNIRAVFIHEFFAKRKKVHDEELLPLIEKTLPVNTAKPNAGYREWYYALMDYGAHLKTTGSNPSRRSRHHTRQSTFEGSQRQLRGEILRRLVAKSLTEKQLSNLEKDPVRLERVLSSLIADGLVLRKNKVISINE